MSAECTKCGADLTYGNWPVGECTPCDLRECIDRAAIELAPVVAGMNTLDALRRVETAKAILGAARDSQRDER